MKDDKIGDRDNLRISNLLCSLTCEQDRWRTAWCCLNCTSSFAICPIELTMCSAWGSWCTCAYLVLSQMLHNRIPRNWSLISAWGFLPDRPVLSAIHGMAPNLQTLRCVLSFLIFRLHLTAWPIALVYCKTNKQQCISTQVNHWLPHRGTYEHDCSTLHVFMLIQRM